jgi:hypothetical protein
LSLTQINIGKINTDGRLSDEHFVGVRWSDGNFVVPQHVALPMAMYADRFGACHFLSFRNTG